MVSVIDSSLRFLSIEDFCYHSEMITIDPYEIDFIIAERIAALYSAGALDALRPDGECGYTCESVFGVCSGPFLEKEFRTVRFTMKVRILGPDEFSYEEDTVLEIPGQPTFHHTDGNTLKRVAG